MARPRLWHLRISHYNEKARWALAYKGVDHTRRSPGPGLHALIAMGLTGGEANTFPILELDGRRVADSTAIIAALEESHPDPPLYPKDATERERALALEDFFDEEVGPSVRLVAFHAALAEPERMQQIAMLEAPPAMQRIAGLPALFGATYVRSRFRPEQGDRAGVARRQVTAGCERLVAELDGRDYLVGDSFTVADLTAASLLFPLASPPQGPAAPPVPPETFFEPGPAGEEAAAWVGKMFERHRPFDPAPLPSSSI